MAEVATRPLCRTCGQPIVRGVAPADPSMLEYHAGCQPGYGRIPYSPPKRQVVPDPFHDHDDEVDCSCLPKPHVYLELPLAFDQRYEDALGQVLIEITREGHNDLCDALGGECPHCGRAMAEGELHS